MELPNNFYTVSTFFTLSGTSMAVLIITSVLDDLFGRGIRKIAKKWIALVLSFVFSLLGATLSTEKGLLVWVVAIVNGFLIYLTSVGWNTFISKGSTRKSSQIRKTSTSGNTSGFFDSWW